MKPPAQYSIELWELSEYNYPGTEECWQADCGKNHARGMTPGQAVQRLIEFMEAVARG